MRLLQDRQCSGSSAIGACYHDKAKANEPLASFAFGDLVPPREFIQLGGSCVWMFMRAGGRIELYLLVCCSWRKLFARRDNEYQETTELFRRLTVISDFCLFARILTGIISIPTRRWSQSFSISFAISFRGSQAGAPVFSSCLVSAL